MRISNLLQRSLPVEEEGVEGDLLHHKLIPNQRLLEEVVEEEAEGVVSILAPERLLLTKGKRRFPKAQTMLWRT